jgi:hypothetical protein
VTLNFLTPLGALVAVLAILPFAGLFVSERRSRRARDVLRLAGPTARSRIPVVVALALVPALLGLALAQPVLRSSEKHLVRTDAQAWYIVDISRSMHASTRAGGTTRFDRALRAALRMRLGLPELASGIATMTDRVLPDLFPTPNEQVFTATLEDALAIDEPPPRGFSERATTFAALDTLEGTNFFNPGIRHRLAIVFTDGETADYDRHELRAALRQGPQTSFVIVHLSRPGERVWNGDLPVRSYRADPRSKQMATELASVVGGREFDEGQVGQAIRAAKQMVGKGPLVQRGEGLRVVALSRWFALAALVPLAFLLWRRNVV